MSSMSIGGAKHAILNTDHNALQFQTFKTHTELAEQAIRSAMWEFPSGGAEHVAWAERQAEALRDHHELPTDNSDPMALLCQALKMAQRMAGTDGDDLRHTLRLLAQHLRRNVGGSEAGQQTFARETPT